MEAFCLCVVYYEVTDLRKKRHPIKDLLLKRFIQEIMSLQLIFTRNLTIAVMIGCILFIYCEIAATPVSRFSSVLHTVQFTYLGLNE